MKRIFVAMSGGVDSSVSAALLKDQGYEVIGVTMCLGITDPRTKGVACCSAESIEDARKVCRQLNIRHHVFSFEKEMQDYIIDDFINEYLKGRTPNPCVRCNQFLKFGKLLQQAKSIGAEHIATGHYAKVECDPAKGYQIKKGKDDRKDQTYFLHTIRRDDLPQILFPLGEFTKGEVRDLARKYKLPIAEKKESQDICFVPEGYIQFLAERIGENINKPGDFINEKGKIVGRHKGIVNYTIGQREKLGIALGYPAYVYRMDVDKNKVYVGPKELLYNDSLRARDVNFVSIDYPSGSIDVMAKVRYQAKEAKARLEMEKGGFIKVTFKEPQMAITPGQSVVFYDGDVLLGGAVIDEVIK